ncbi:hypothetical protein GIS00_11025 [Nakamurella sp. YIM 132087]|uniref:Uncharacterized protein n=1 Tax=Nakamurella alba TaxID=2665158 RepID=A0A7K1FK47_9ACTN|nr:hypothetical protein [Nakamurella alba]MTD14478.1 hypothetical protein [Nakamurella alba]
MTARSPAWLRVGGPVAFALLLILFVVSSGVRGGLASARPTVVKVETLVVDGRTLTVTVMSDGDCYISGNLDHLSVMAACG